jgi:hypothetical protein
VANNRAELEQELATECPFWGQPEWNRFLDMSEEDQYLTMRGLKLSAQGPGPDFFSGALQILSVAVTVITDVGGVAGAVNALRAL